MTMSTTLTRPIAAAVALLVGAGLAACTDNTKSGDDAASGAIKVTSTSTECKVDKGEAPSGTVSFDVKNEGDQVTEFYLLGKDGLRIVGEVENIGPGISRKLVVTAVPGEYVTACKPGMVGDGIRGAFKVTDSGKPLVAAGATGELAKQATTQYVAYVHEQVEELVEATTEFTNAYKAGQDDAARAQYAPARMHWERIEPVAESFGDLDPKMDAREADLEPGQEWTGWHRIEKDLWPPASGYTPLTPAERTAVADQLLADTKDLATRVESLELAVDNLGNGAKELLDEVATGKVTGEEEIWSHTDLWDFQANVDGARVAFENLQPIVQTKDKELDSTLTRRFAELQTLLDKYKSGDGFVLYDTLTPDQVKELSDSVSALGEPLSRLTEVALS